MQRLQEKSALQLDNMQALERRLAAARAEVAMRSHRLVLDDTPHGPPCSSHMHICKAISTSIVNLGVPICRQPS